MSDSGVVRLSLPAEPEFVQVARLTCAGVASRLGFDFEAVEDVRLAVAEAVTLVLRAGDEQPGGCVWIEVTWNREEVVIETVYGGRGGTPRDSGDADEADVALLVMAAMMDDVVASQDADGRPTVRLVKCRGAARAEID